MNTGEEIHLTQDNRFMCKDDFLTHTKNFCKNLSGKNLTKKNYLSYYFVFFKMILMMILVNHHQY
jgi:hypothetical protein